MTVKFALFLSPEGIALAHRQDAGHWAMIGEVPVAADDLAGEMATLNAAIVTRGGADQPLLLVLPDDQILYTSFTAPTHDAGLVQDRIVAGLDGLTPYAVADLVYDWRAVEADRIKVAVVARETLDEANAFAAEHGLSVAGFAAMPPVERFPGMPVFGTATPAVEAATSDLRFGPDEWVAPEEPAPEEPEAEAEAPSAEIAAEAPPEGQDAPITDSGTDTTDDTQPEAAAEAPSAAPVPKAKRKPASQRDVADDGAAAPELPLTDAQPDDAPAAADGNSLADTAKTADTAPDTPADEATHHAPPDSAEDAATPQTKARTKAEGGEADAPAAETGAPVTGAPDDAEPATDTADAPATRQSDADGSDDAATPTPDETAPQEPAALAALLDPMFDRTITPITPSDTGAAEQVPDTPTTAPSPSAARGKVARPKADGRNLTAEKPDTAPPRPSGAMPVLPPADASGGAIDPAADAAAPSTPVFGFSAKRRASGKAATTANTESGRIVANIRGRLGFGATPSPDEKQRHPDVTLPPARRADSVADRPGSAFVAQLARVRDASKSRVKPDSAPARTPPPPQDAAADQPEVAAGRSGPTIAARIMGRGTAKTAADAPGGADSALAAGLLARKASQPAGPSLRTGLLLTVVLLILLVLIAIWSVVFLPDSPMARIFGGGSATQTAQNETLDQADAPADAAATTPTAALAPLPAAATDPEELADGAVAEEAVSASPAPVQSAQAPAVPATPLPDIDADLDLPPLAPPAEALLPSIAEAEALYADAQIWPRPPERPFFSPFTLTDDIYIASIDPEIVAFDAVALADPRIDIDEVLRRVPAPPAFGLQLERDARGLVAATADGVLTPEGAFVILGRPAVVALPRPTEIAPEQAAPDTLNVADAILSTISPRPRPTDLDETRERQLFGGLSRTELAAMRPTLRPISAQESAARASLFPQTDAPSAADTPAAPVTGGTARAVAASRVPRLRPDDFATIVAAAARTPAQPPTVTAAAFAPAPSIPSNADVARAATSRNEIRLRDVNLIGVSGTSSNRTALVRLSSGRFVRVSVGDRLDGGRVAAIGADSLQYVVNGRNITLEIPG